MRSLLLYSCSYEAALPRSTPATHPGRGLPRLTCNNVPGCSRPAYSSNILPANGWGVFPRSMCRLRATTGGTPYDHAEYEALLSQLLPMSYRELETYLTDVQAKHQQQQQHHQQKQQQTTAWNIINSSSSTSSDTEHHHHHHQQQQQQWLEAAWVSVGSYTNNGVAMSNGTSSSSDSKQQQQQRGSASPTAEPPLVLRASFLFWLAAKEKASKGQDRQVIATLGKLLCKFPHEITGIAPCVCFASLWV